MDKSSPFPIQTWIHYFEEGAGRPWASRVLAAVCLAGVAVLFLSLEARDFGAPEAMDQAQLARNLADGRGYTTWNIRPLSIHLLQQLDVDGGGDGKRVLLRPHPDLANPPIYPVLLACVFRILPEPFRHGAASLPISLHRPPPELAVGALNLAIFALAMWLMWRGGIRWLGASPAAFGALAFYGCFSVWTYVCSGLPTTLLWVWVILLADALMRFEGAVRAAPEASGQAVKWSAAAGLICGLAGLTQYSAAALAVPSAFFLARTGGRWRWRSALTALAVFAVVMTPWLVRNWRLCHNPFGVAGYSLFATTASFPGARLERSFSPHIGMADWRAVVLKTFNNSLEIVIGGVPRLAQSWMGAFFVASLFVPFKDIQKRRFRGAALGMTAALIVAEAASRTESSRLAPDFGAENLMILAAPLGFLLGASVVQALLGAGEYAFPLLRRLAKAGALVLISLQLFVALASDVVSLTGLTPRRQLPLVDPPYRPDIIRMVAAASPDRSMLMSDIPWAVAWYGGRPTVWLPLRVQDDFKEDFYSVHVYQHPIWGVYISPLTANAPLREKFIADVDFAWGRFYMDVFLRRNLPKNFPLNQVFGDGLMGAGHCFVALEDTWSGKKH